MLRGVILFLVIRHLVLREILLVHHSLLLWKIQAAHLTAFHNVTSTSFKAGVSSEIHGHWTWTQLGVYWDKDGKDKGSKLSLNIALLRVS